MAFPTEHLIANGGLRRRRTARKRHGRRRAAPNRTAHTVLQMIQAIVHAGPDARNQRLRRRRRRPRRLHRATKETTQPLAANDDGIAGVLLPFPQSLVGLFRVFNDAEYRFYRSQGTPPVETDTPFATNPTLPYEPPGIRYGDGTWFLAVSYFDGAVESGFYPIGPNGEPYMIVEILEEQIATDLTVAPPIDWRLEQRSGGAVWIIATYLRGNGYPAEQFTYSWSDDGTEPPDPGYSTIDLTPTVSPYFKQQGFDTDARVVLEKKLDDYADTTVIRCKLGMAAGQITIGSGVYWPISAITELTLTVDISGPSAPIAGRAWTAPKPEVGA